ncbi:MAG TPA: PAS domain S-box protein [Stellaceae bacterium]|nr:PAS domain S-box protein [Stellaceae bacterium]
MPVDGRFHQLLEALPAAIYTTDAEGRLTFYNEAAVEFSGRRPRLGSDRWCISWRLYFPDGTPLPLGECPMAVALKEDRPVRGVDAILERPDGTRVHFLPFPTPLHDASGALIGAVNMLIDISDRKNAETAQQRLTETLEQRVAERTQEMAEALAQLRVSEEHFRTLVQGVTDYAIFMLDPDGVVTSWNLGAERIKGYAAEEIIGRHFSQFYTAEDRQNGLPQRALEMARRTGKFEAEGWRVRQDGTVFWAGVLIDAIRDGTGKLMGFAKITRDLTERRAAEEQLRQAQRMEVVGQLTGGVAHDFNNLLTAIIGNLEMLVTTLPEEGAGRRYANAALRAGLRGSQLIQQLLTFSRRQEVCPQVVNINELLQETLTLCQRTLGEGIEIEQRLQPRIWTCLADSAQFEAMILNLAANARDAMGLSGRLTVATANVTAGGSDDGIDVEQGEYVMVSVSDTGCGMSADVLMHAFEPFYTTKDVGKGTGLGLSQVYGFAKQSGGTARIESQKGLGTTVHIYLPRKDGLAAQPDMSPSAFAPTERGGVTVLVVEDDPDVCEMIVAMLSDLGYRTLVARTGPEALALLRSERAIDLLFTDVVMPAGMSGIDLARTASRLRPDLRILLTSGYAGAVQEALEPGGEFKFLAKPYRTPTLEMKLREALGEDALRRSA